MPQVLNPYLRRRVIRLSNSPHLSFRFRLPLRAKKNWRGDLMRTLKPLRIRLNRPLPFNPSYRRTRPSNASRSRPHAVA